MILWLSRDEQQRLLPLGLFELRVNMVGTVDVTEAPKPRSYHVFLLVRVALYVTDVTETHVPP
jgi:hypothetical protein